LITTIAAALGLALIMGFVTARLKLPALVGYLVAGIIIGPATPGFVADIELSNQLAEIGVMLLMFGVGLHFSLDDLLAVRRIALPGALVQIAVATLLGIGVTALWGWSLAAGIVFGLALSVASTVVLLRALESLGVLESVNGRIAVGWLVVEDLVMVLVLVLLPPLSVWLGGNAATPAEGAGDQSLLTTLALALGRVSFFVALMLVVGRRKNESMMIGDDLQITVVDVQPGGVMLVLSRKTVAGRLIHWIEVNRQLVVIGQPISLGVESSCVVTHIDGGKVRLGFNVPVNSTVHRKEVYDLVHPW